MSPEQENFDSLRKLLALKRHEQPPPGYFNGFSNRVIARIQAGEKGDNALERLSWDGSWFRRLWGLLDARPILAGAVGAGACGLLIAAVMYSERPDGGESANAYPQVEVNQPTVFAGSSTSPNNWMNQLPGGSDASNPGDGAPVRNSLFKEIQDSQKAWVVPASLNSSPSGN
jgi:hypothetical protein